MSNLTTKEFFAKENVKTKFNEILGKNSTSFITSVLQIVNSSDMLKEANVDSVYNAAMLAATLNLPINNNLGFAYIIPFRDRNKGVLAQFQIGYKGFIQLAQRSGQVKKIAATEVYTSNLISSNPLKGNEYDWTKREGEIIGYVAYLELVNGFEAELYMTITQMKEHANKFSQTYKKGYGVWKDDFDSMAKKTVVKLLLAKYAPLSVDMQKAIITDQSVIKDESGNEVQYVDTEVIEIDKIEERKKEMIANCTTMVALNHLQEQNPDWDINLFDEQKNKIEGGKNA